MSDMRNRFFALLLAAALLLSGCAAKVPGAPQAEQAAPVSDVPRETEAPPETPALLVEETGSATADEIRYMLGEGAVRVEDEDGERLTLREKMRLYSGYAVGTGDQARAVLSLDRSKAATIDESSRAGITQKGRDLELSLTEGGLFFKVTEKLEPDESFTIRTADAVMGIRGTSGYVFADGAGHSFFLLTSGSAEITAEGETALLRAGERIDVTLSPSGPVLETRPVTEAELPRLLLEELTEDEALLQTVQEESGLDAEMIRQLAEEDGPVTVGDMTIYTVDGLRIPIPTEYLDRLEIRTEPYPDGDDPKILISVYEKKSIEDAARDFPDRQGNYGYLFSIARRSERLYEDWIAHEYPGESVFARDGSIYYFYDQPTDVTFYRTGMNAGRTPTQEELAENREMGEVGSLVRAGILERNPSLEAFG